jgi:hypothetical protein
MRKLSLIRDMPSIKKQSLLSLLVSSSISWTSAEVLFVGLILTIIITPSSFANAFADYSQITVPEYSFIATSSSAADTLFHIPLSTEDENEVEEEEKQNEEKPMENAASSSTSSLRIAFVKPSFTYAAYQLNGFYTFYQKARELPNDTANVITADDLNLLTVKVSEGPYLNYRDDPTDTPRIPSQQNYYDKLRELVEDKADDSENIAIDIEDITDKDVHEGAIFDSDGNNIYDVLFLFHQEYVTQAEYDNLMKFVVQNGGTIVFNDANIFAAEVKYDDINNNVTLVRGHGWAYDDVNRNAWRAESERWLDENQQWVGSNFIEIPATKNITFSNNPFNYDHSEEQIVTNPNARIILDYGVIEDVVEEIEDEAGDKIRDMQHFPGFGKVATYEMISGKGKVINIGIFAHKLEDNQAFLDFYESEIIPRAFGQ